MKSLTMLLLVLMLAGCGDKNAERDTGPHYDPGASGPNPYGLKDSDTKK